MQMEKNIWVSLHSGDQLVIRSNGGDLYFRFRQDPVPSPKYSHGWKNSDRHYRTAREKRAYADPEVAAYARPRRKQELSVVYEVRRVSERSWKSHRKHQWK